jgi:quinol monooxygenase YgiN
MITERLTFRAKYGQGDELTTLLREWLPKMGKQAGMVAARLYADVTGPMFTVVAESDFADFAAYATFFSQDEAMYSDAQFQAWFERMTAATESGERQLYRMETLI